MLQYDFIFGLPAVLSGFVPGNNGDVLDLGDAISFNTDGRTNPFATGNLALIQRGPDVVLQFSYAGGDQFLVDITTFPGHTLAEFTAYNFFGFDPLDGAIAAGIALNGLAANETLLGTSGDDTIHGADGADSISGFYGNDALFGDAGADTLNGGGGADTIHGGIGDDVIDGGNQGDMLFGDDGNDYIAVKNYYGSGGAGVDTIDGGAGDDTISDGQTADIIFGGDGNDVITHRDSGSPTIDGGNGDDRITVDQSAASYTHDQSHIFNTVTISAGAGNDTVAYTSTYDGSAVIDLGAGNDFVIANMGFASTAITLGAGVDTVVLGHFKTQYPTVLITDFATGNGGDVFDLATSLTGGYKYFYAMNLTTWDGQSNPFGNGYASLVQAGSDTILRIWPGADHSATGGYYDVARFAGTTVGAFTAANFVGLDPAGTALVGVNLAGTAGDDRLSGTLTHDTLSGLAGNDTLIGLAGNDTILGGDGNDSIDAGRGDNHVDGGAGADTIVAADGVDVIHGGAGADVIDDTGGAVAIYGEGGNDVITVIGFGATGIVDSGDDDDTIMFSTLSSTALNITVLAGAGNDTVAFSANAQYVAPAAALIDLGAGNDTITAGVGDFSPKIMLGAGIDTVIVGSSVANPNFLDILDFTTGDGGDVFNFANYVGNASFDLQTVGNPFTGEMWTRLVQVGPDVFLQYDMFGQGLVYVPLACFRNTALAAFTNYNFAGIDIHPVTPAGITLTAPAGGGSLSGGRWADTLIGQGGNDELLGGFGNDTLQGNGGADTINGGPGNNLISGGDGNDLIITGLAGYVHSDTVDGGAGDDKLVIYDSVGTASGGSGDDLIEVHGAVGSIDGGAGTDTLAFVNVGGSTVGISLDLTGLWTGAPAPADPNALSIRGVEIITGLSGTDGADHFVLGTGHTGVPLDPVHMNGGDDYIDVGDAAAAAYGDAGNDHMVGGAKADSLRGGDGNDTIEGLGGNDDLTGEAGDDRLDGGDGNDQLYGFGGGDLLIGGNGDDQLYGVDGNDTLQGGAGADMLAIGAGVDIAQGGDGDDAFRIDPGWLFVGDVLDGGAGIDRMLLNFSGDFAGLSFNLTGYWSGMTGAIGGATVSNIETFVFDLSNWSDHIVLGADAPFAQTVDGKGGDDTISGGAANDLLLGGDGNDWLAGGLGDDTIDGGAGDDTVVFGGGVDTLGGGDGNNLLLASGAGAVLHLRTGGAPNTDLVASSWLVTGFQTISAGGFANVTMVGTDNFDSIDLTGITLVGIGAIRGLDGNDRITGTAGADIIDGGAGNDTIDGGAGADALYGGAGDDTFTIDTAADLVFENPGEGTDSVVASVGHYLLANVENLTLAWNAGAIFGVGNELANTLTGNDSANLLIAGAGDDTVHGGDGNDALFGQDGADLLLGDGGIDYLVGDAGNDTLDGGLGADALYGGSGDDVLTGGIDFVTDILVGGDGNDVLHGDGGGGDYDLMDGGAGNDTYYVDTGNDLTFEAANGGTDTVIANIAGANSGVYLYANVEDLILSGMTTFGVGNALDNHITGNFVTNLLLGGAGNDTINGKGGTDVLFGQAGSDTFVFERGTAGDVIGDFTRGQDKIEIDGIYTSFNQMKTHFVQVGTNGAIDLGAGDLIVLQGVTMSQLTAADFILV